MFIKLRNSLLALLTVTPILSLAEVHEDRPTSFARASQVKKGGQLNLRLSVPPLSLVNHWAASDSFFEKEDLIYGQLFLQDPETLNYVPMIADDYLVSDDKKSITIKLSKDAVWQDGAPITQDDVVFTVNYLKSLPSNIHSPYVQAFSKISVSKEGGDSVRFLISDLSFDSFWYVLTLKILQQKQWDNVKPEGRIGIIPVGSGPYRIRNAKLQEKLELERNDKWWGFKKPYFKNIFNVEKITFHVIPDEKEAYQQFISGNLSTLKVSAGLFSKNVVEKDKQKFDKAEDGKNKFWYLETPLSDVKPVTFLAMNAKTKSLGTKKTREALAKALDVRTLIGTYSRDHVYPQSFWGSAEDADEETTIPLPEKELAGAWFKEGGKPKELSIVYLEGDPEKQTLVDVIISQLQPFGIKVRPKALRPDALFQTVQQRDYELALLEHSGSAFPNAEVFFGKNNIFGLDEAIEKKAAEAADTLDESDRKKLVKDLETAVMAEVPFILIDEQKVEHTLISKGISSSVWSFRYSKRLPWEFMHTK